MHLSFVFVACLSVLVAGHKDDSVGVEAPKYSLNPVYMPAYYQQPYPEAGRFFWSTTTTTTTSTSTVTCTVSTNVACGGRRRRGILEEDDDAIVPSAVEPVEASAVVDTEFTRKGRKADPQYVIAPAPLYASYQPYELDSAFGIPHQPYYYPYPAAPVRNWFGLTSLFVTTKTSTVFTVFTSSSTPTCSTTGSIAQCPNSG